LFDGVLSSDNSMVCFCCKAFLKSDMLAGLTTGVALIWCIACVISWKFHIYSNFIWIWPKERSVNQGQTQKSMCMWQIKMDWIWYTSSKCLLPSTKLYYLLIHFERLSESGPLTGRWLCRNVALFTELWGFPGVILLSRGSLCVCCSVGEQAARLQPYQSVQPLSLVEVRHLHGWHMLCHNS
jgi:hypothetical protein